MEHAKHEESDVMPRSVDDVPAGQEMHAWELEGGWVVSESADGLGTLVLGQGDESCSSRTHAAVDGTLEIFVLRMSKVALAIFAS